MFLQTELNLHGWYYNFLKFVVFVEIDIHIVNSNNNSPLSIQTNIQDVVGFVSINIFKY